MNETGAIFEIYSISAIQRLNRPDVTKMSSAKAMRAHPQTNTPSAQIEQRKINHREIPASLIITVARRYSITDANDATTAFCNRNLIKSAGKRPVNDGIQAETNNAYEGQHNCECPASKPVERDTGNLNQKSTRRSHVASGH